MPRGDRTGPMGQGPMTGRGAGYCAGYDAPGYANQMPGRGFGMGRGGGWGRGNRWRNWFRATGLPGWMRFGGAPVWTPPTREQEADSLKAEAGWLKQQLDAITQRLNELENT
ncbi:MAG: DUF5320 domain-containing protein [Anaerolineae bacterium]|nr:DUF5320 domain-containing protein [Anaerolineae bacterium]